MYAPRHKLDTVNLLSLSCSSTTKKICWSMTVKFRHGSLKNHHKAVSMTISNSVMYWVSQITPHDIFKISSWIAWFMTFPNRHKMSLGPQSPTQTHFLWRKLTSRIQLPHHTMSTCLVTWPMTWPLTSTKRMTWHWHGQWCGADMESYDDMANVAANVHFGP